MSSEVGGTYSRAVRGGRSHWEAPSSPFVVVGASVASLSLALSPSTSSPVVHRGTLWFSFPFVFARVRCRSRSLSCASGVACVRYRSRPLSFACAVVRSSG